MSYGNVPLSFEANQGQSDAQVKFLARGDGYSLFLTPTEAVLALRAPAHRQPSTAEPIATAKRLERTEPTEPLAVVRMRLVGANAHPQLTGLELLPGTSNYFIGSDPERWQRNVAHYAKVKYAGVYRGIDLVYYGKQRQLEYDLVIAPGADPSRIALAFEGVQKLSLDPHGNLILQTTHGDIAQHKPLIYQDIGGKRQQVDGRYVLRANETVGFEVGSYDTDRSLVIDPVMTYSTYLGGTGSDAGEAIAVDSAGNAYVTGWTLSTDFPIANPFQSTPARGDVFITKLNAAGSALVYSTYLGGSGGEDGAAIAVDSAGNAYVTGSTDSPSAGAGITPFPRVGAFQPTYGGQRDAFVTKLNAAGNGLHYSTYLGGSRFDGGSGIAVDAAGNAYVTGRTDTLTGLGDFPTVAPFQSQAGSPNNSDAFVTKFNAVGMPVYSTYLGGSDSEQTAGGQSGGIVVDGDGHAYVAGTTASRNFPGAGASTIQATNNGADDGFVVKFNAAGSALIYSTYLGGELADVIAGLAIDSARNAYVVGSTSSLTFPIVAALQPGRIAQPDGFVTKINAAGSALVYSTYLGGNLRDYAAAVAVDSGGNAYITGSTDSTNFPTAAPLQAIPGGRFDMFISALNAAGSALLYSTYWGGSADEAGYGIAVDSLGDAYVTGYTNSVNFPTVSPIQATFRGVNDAFVVKIESGIGPPTNLMVTSIVGNTVTITFTAPANSATLTGYELAGGILPGQVLGSLLTGSTATTFTFVAPTGAFYIRVHALAPGFKSVASNEIRIFVNLPAPPSAPGNLLTRPCLRPSSMLDADHRWAV